MSYDHCVDEDINDYIEDNTDNNNTNITSTILEKIKNRLQLAIQTPKCQKCLTSNYRLVNCNCNNNYCIGCIKHNMCENIIETGKFYYYIDDTNYRSYYRKWKVEMPCKKNDCSLSIKKILSEQELNDFNKIFKTCSSCYKIYHPDKTKIYYSCGIITCVDCAVRMVIQYKCYDNGCSYEDYHIIRDPIHYNYTVSNIVICPAKEIITKEIFEKHILNNIKLECKVCYNMSPKRSATICECGNQVCNRCLVRQVSNKYSISFKKPDYETHSIDCLNPECDLKILSKSFMSQLDFSRTVKELNLKPKYCVENDCNGFLNNGKCVKCYTDVCQKCHQKFHDGDCKEEDIEVLQKTVQYGGCYFRNCPRCNELIFKNEGCENMFCWNCSITFDWEGDMDEYKTFDFSGYNFYKLYKKALKKGININPNDFEDTRDFSISRLYNSDGELSPDSDEEEITREFSNDKSDSNCSDDY